MTGGYPEQVAADSQRNVEFDLRSEVERQTIALEHEAMAERRRYRFLLVLAALTLMASAVGIALIVGSILQAFGSSGDQEAVTAIAGVGAGVAISGVLSAVVSLLSSWRQRKRGREEQGRLLFEALYRLKMHELRADEELRALEERREVALRELRAIHEAGHALPEGERYRVLRDQEEELRQSVAMRALEAAVASSMNDDLSERA